MSNSRRLVTITVPGRKFCAALPAVALMSVGIAFSAPSAPVASIKSVAVSSDSTSIVVPDTALSLPAPAGASPENLPVAIPEAPAAKTPVLGTGIGISSRVNLDSSGIPVRALEAYRRAASLIDAADPGCKIDWTLLAAIGRVESNHARFGGNQLDAAGVAQPGIIGIPLDGSSGTALITDTDGGALDRDTVFDRAVGPMQFIPSTWRVAGVDADGDGVKNPQDMADAAAATALYLCSGPGDLSRPDDLRSAIMRYNASDAYVQMVISIAENYRLGVSALPDAGPIMPAAVKPAAKPAAVGSILTALLAQTATPTVGVLTVAAASVVALPAPGTPAAIVAADTAVPPVTTTSTPTPVTIAPTTVPPTTVPPTTVPPTTVPPTP